MQLDKDHKFNFFKKEQKYVKYGADFFLSISLVAMAGIVAYAAYPVVQKNSIEAKKLSSNVVIPKDTIVSGTLTAQNTFVSTMAPTFVVHPQTDSLGMISPDSFQSMSQKEKLTYWVQNQEPGIQLKPDEIQKIVKIMQKNRN